MTHEQFTLVLDADADDIKIVDEELTAYNRSHVGKRPSVPIRIVLKSPAGDVVAGLNGSLVWGWLFLQELWVHETFRRSGLGTRLMRAAEEQAQSKGGVGAYLVTYDFQARGFYEKLGYSLNGEIANHPDDHFMFFMSKRFE